MAEIKTQDYAKVACRIQRYMATLLRESGAEGFVLGLSGGIDSAVVAYLCRTEDLNGKVLAIIMPDTKVTPESETADAQRIISILGIPYKLIDINPILYEYSMYLEPNEDARANLRARVRSDILYYYANAKNYLVLGSSDKSEYMLGYFTKYGDGASDLAPIASLYKLQVRELARYLEVPDSIVSKKSSPHLRKGQDAEDEIGASYEDVDSVLWCIAEKGMSATDASKAAQVDVAMVGRIVDMNRASRHKRAPPMREEMDDSCDVAQGAGVL